MMPGMNKNLFNVLLFLAGVLVLPLASCRDAAPGEDPEEVHVILAGHLYSLYTRNRSEKNGPDILTDRWLRLFAREVNERNPDALFLLGDLTRFSQEEEWDLIDRALKPIKAATYRLPGNHDLRQPANFTKHGGTGNRAVNIGSCKFILLDNKAVLEAEDLAFLDLELAAGESFAHTFVLMHYCMINWNDAHPEQDPREPYPGVSNWNRDVVPRLAGRVSWVFCGDHTPGGPTRYVQEYRGEKIHYIMASFVFRRGETDDVNGEGPNIYLELTVRGDDVEILPRILPIPVTDPWYRNFNLEEHWALTSVAGAWVWLPPGWTRQSSAGEDAFSFRDGSGAASLTGVRVPLAPGQDLASWRRRQQEALTARHQTIKVVNGGSFNLWHQRADWQVVQFDDSEDLHFFCSLVFKGEVWSFTGTGPASAFVPGRRGNWLSQMLRLLGSMKTRGELSH